MSGLLLHAHVSVEISRADPKVGGAAHIICDYVCVLHAVLSCVNKSWSDTRKRIDYIKVAHGRGTAAALRWLALQV